MPRWWPLTIDSALERVGKASIICHSRSGPLALRLAHQASHLAHAVVAIEPAGIPELSPEAYKTPTLVMMGGNIESDKRWTLLDEKIRDFAAMHGHVEILSLPALGIDGNSHVMMMDTNSADIAGRVNEWLRQID